MIPSFLLAKLYVKGSLKNTEAGFEFAMKNIIDAATLIGIGPIRVGDKIYEGDAVAMIVENKPVNGTELSSTTPVIVRMGALLKVSVAGDKLAIGSQKISVCATTSEIGMIKFDIRDNVG